MKTPTLRQKVEMYEEFLHKINMFVVSGNNAGIGELICNADKWSYAHRCGNGELTDRKQQQCINNAFWKLCDTLEANRLSKERQKAYTETQKQTNNYYGRKSRKTVN